MRKKEPIDSSIGSFSSFYTFFHDQLAAEAASPEED